jgi:hypothetical protein
MGRRDRAWPHHLSSLTGFCSARPQARKNFTHDSAFISGGSIALPNKHPRNGTTVRTKLRLRNRFPNTAMEIFGRCGKMRVG